MKSRLAKNLFHLSLLNPNDILFDKKILIPNYKTLSQ
jgi:hypothetical protein